MNTSSNRQRNLEARVQFVAEYMEKMQAENPSFYYAFQGDSGNVFWADRVFRENYTFFGDTVRIDTSYRTNRTKLPLVSFTGINNHAQPVLFGCGLLLNESDNSFMWLLQTWFQSMSGRSPVSITTDPDRLVQMAVAQVIPEAHHRFCRWSIFTQTQEKLGHAYQTNPTFDLEFKKCINEANSVEEFESYWAAFLDRYFLLDNEWLQSLYRIREQWIPVFTKDVFFGELSSADCSGCTSLFFHEYMSISTTLQSLMSQYEKAVLSWQEKELKEDFDSSNTTPVLKTPSPMEKQAATLYTRRIFVKFQDELVETLANPATMIDDSSEVTTYRVAKFGEEHRAHTVRLNTFEMKAVCSCRMFDFSGIICRHVLSVFRTKNILTLPSEYVLKRWTRNCKTVDGASTNDNSRELPSYNRESPIIRHNNLHKEALKYVEEGAKSIHSYTVAMAALQEAAKKVATIKICRATTPSTNVINEVSQEIQTTENQSSLPLTKEDKEKKIRKLTAELDRANQKCEVYRAILLALFKDVEDHKLKLSVKVQNARVTLKE